jgi:hypothetical protein
LPTIEQLAPATAASDSDVILISQGGITRKITRAKIVAGLQPQISIPSGSLLGRSSSGIGGTESITIGQNLSFSGGTLAAAAAPFAIGLLPSGVTPAVGDLIAVSQAGTTVAVSYKQLMNNLPALANVDGSQLVVTPTGSKIATKLGDLTAAMLNLSGGTVTGVLALATEPIAASHAATKSYVDSRVATAMPISGGTVVGSVILAGDPTVSSQAATKNYVDTQAGTLLPKLGGTLSGSLTLAADPATPLQAATKQYADTHIRRTGDTFTGQLTLAADPALQLQAATKRYVDAQTATNLATSGGTLAGALVLSSDPTLPLQAATKQYADARIMRVGDTLTGSLMLAADPTAPMHASTKGYVDAQAQAALPKSGGILSGPLQLSSDPTGALQATTKQYVDTRLLRTGDTLVGPLMLAADPIVSLQAATKGYVDNQSGSALPRAGGTLTGPLALSGDPTAPVQASTKRYVDAQTATALPLSGGTLTGALNLSAAPSLGSHAATKTYVDSQIGTTMPVGGGTFTGAVTISSPPTQPLHAATKQYVDANPNSSGVINVKLAPFGALLDGKSDDTAAFKAAYQAAASGATIYVPNGIVRVQAPGSWGIDLSKRVKWVVDGATLPDGASIASVLPNGVGPSTVFLPGVVVGNTSTSATVSQAGSQGSDFAVLHSSYIVNHNGGPINTVIANTRNDTIIYNSPNNYVWGGLDRLIWVGTQSPVAASPAQHVARYVQAIRQSIATASNGTALPQPQLWAACLEYRDTTGKSSSWTNDSLVVEMDWIGNGPDDGHRRQVQSLVIAQHDQAGLPVEVSTVLGVYLGSGSTGKVYTVFNVGIPFSNAVLDTTYSQQLAGASAIKMAAGHAIAFEATNSNKLAFDSATGTLRWYQGSLSYVVGKGLSVGWVNVCSGNTTLPNYLAGNMVVLIGGGTYTITLPLASTVASGTGFTFSSLTNGIVPIVPSGSDTIDLSPIVLRQHDRYHIVSDGSNTWREVFRTNSMGPRFGAPPILPSYTVATLPSTFGAGAKAFATNGRKPGEAVTAGTGVEVFHDGVRWISVCGGAAVAA